MKHVKRFVFSTLLYIFILGKFVVIVVSSHEVRNLDEPIITIPQVPRPPNCVGSSFPGSVQWNQCWENFRRDMAWFQLNMQEYSSKLSKMIEKNTAKGKFDFPKMGIVTSSSNIMTNGYTIQTKGLSISTTTQNDKLHIKLPIHGMEYIQSKINNNELELAVGQQTNENARWALIRFPESVKFTDLKFQRMDDGILIIGPIKQAPPAVFQQHYISSFPSGGFAVASMNPPGGGHPRQQNSQMWFF